MEKKPSQGCIGNLIGIVSFMIPIAVILLVLNWAFRLTPYQGWQGMPILIAPFACAAGALLSLAARAKSPGSIAKWSLIVNIILMAAALLYWPLGTLIFRP